MQPEPLQPSEQENFKNTEPHYPHRDHPVLWEYAFSQPAQTNTDATTHAKAFQSSTVSFIPRTLGLETGKKG